MGWGWGLGLGLGLGARVRVPSRVESRALEQLVARGRLGHAVHACWARAGVGLRNWVGAGVGLGLGLGLGVVRVRV